MNWDPNFVAENFKNLWPGPLVRESGWLFPFGEAMHFIGLCLLLGSMFIIDLRLMGWFKSISVRAALSFLPYAIIGFIINLASGWLFFTSAPASYLENNAFLLKMLLILIAGVNALGFTLWEQPKVIAIGPEQETPQSAKIFAGLSLFLWLFILLLGRWLPIFTVGTN